jgi:hypothetical protein
MGQRSEIAPKIQLLANRLRCPNCNADSTEAIFVVADEIKFRRSFERPGFRQPPAFVSGKHLRINRTQELENTEILVRVCLRCGTSRKTSIPNI